MVPFSFSNRKDCLAITISSVADESTFSTEGRAQDSFRSSLTPKVIQSLICAQDWLKHALHHDIKDGNGDAQAQKIKLGNFLSILYYYFI